MSLTLSLRPHYYGISHRSQEGASPIETVYGNLKGLKPSQLKQLQRLYHQRLPGDCVVTPEFAQRLAAVSTDIDSPLCAYINRRGQVIRVGVGTLRQTQIPPSELPRYGAERLSGIRCVTTQFELAPPSDTILTTMALQRLDVLAVLALTGTGFTRRGGGATGYIENAYLAHLVPHPEQRWLVSEPIGLDDLAQQDFLALAEGLEAEFSRAFTALQVEDDRDRVLVVGLFTQDQSDDHFHTRLEELERLVDSAGGEVMETLYQKRPRPHPQTVLGAGKVQEVALAAQTVGANLIVFDRDLSPMQVRNLEDMVGLRVVDRTELILDIFAQRAKSGAGKLQVELAQLEYQMPRLKGRGQALSRQGGGIGTRGPGETKLETERRAIQRRINKLQQEVNQLQAHRARLRHRRQDDNLPSIAVVGYTNAGKSTLVNTLTNSEVYAADQLFATLDPTTRRLAITDPETNETTQLVVTDTVGFIEELPASLMDAFRATLEEVTEADALLHVVDVSHPAWQDQIHWVMRILKDMPIVPGPMLLVFNKADRVSSETLAIAQEEYPNALFISATERMGLETLRSRLLQLIDYAVTV
ncbi:GTPase HflX [filamentous cyanobacterium CCP3]|nr:GTPase HflX [filamentous cyanobacterium CCP3]